MNPTMMVSHAWVFVIVNADGLVFGRHSRWTDSPERFICYDKPAEAVRASEGIAGAAHIARHFMILVEVDPCQTQEDSPARTPN